MCVGSKTKKRKNIRKRANYWLVVTYHPEQTWKWRPGPKNARELGLDITSDDGAVYEDNDLPRKASLVQELSFLRMLKLGSTQSSEFNLECWMLILKTLLQKLTIGTADSLVFGTSLSTLAKGTQ